MRAVVARSSLGSRAWVRRKSGRCFVIDMGGLKGGEGEFLILLFLDLVNERFVGGRERMDEKKTL